MGVSKGGDGLEVDQLFADPMRLFVLGGPSHAIHEGPVDKGLHRFLRCDVGLFRNPNAIRPAAMTCATKIEPNANVQEPASVSQRSSANTTIATTTTVMAVWDAIDETTRRRSQRRWLSIGALSAPVAPT